MRRPVFCLLAASIMSGAASHLDVQESPRVTILADAFTERTDVELGWGFAALVEYDGRRILFDTSSDPDLLAANARTLGVDLSSLDFVVISHRHGDHANGLRHVLAVTPDVPIYAPADEYFGTTTPTAYFERTVPELPQHMRYFRGDVPDAVTRGSAWPVEFRGVASAVEIAPGIRLVANRDESGNFRETPELSLVLDTPDGQVVVVGCSHPGIERILASVNAKEEPVAAIVGGLHLVTTPTAEIERLVHALQTEWNVPVLAAGHCTGEYAFDVMQQAYGARYRYAGAGSVVDLRRLPDR